MFTGLGKVFADVLPFKGRSVAVAIEFESIDQGG
jgi:hypothetical protein